MKDIFVTRKILTFFSSLNGAINTIDKIDSLIRRKY
jgi:hypothetical protein